MENLVVTDDAAEILAGNDWDESIRRGGGDEIRFL
jgi:hypothetical protein